MYHYHPYEVFNHMTKVNSVGFKSKIGLGICILYAVVVFVGFTQI